MLPCKCRGHANDASVSTSNCLGRPSDEEQRFAQLASAQPSDQGSSFFSPRAPEEAWIHPPLWSSVLVPQHVYSPRSRSCRSEHPSEGQEVILRCCRTERIVQEKQLKGVIVWTGSISSEWECGCDGEQRWSTVGIHAVGGTESRGRRRHIEGRVGIVQMETINGCIFGTDGQLH